MKTCVRCEVEKPLECFRVRSDTKKPRSHCYACEFALSQERGKYRIRRKRVMPKWPWPPGTKVFEDIKLKHRTA